ncbi:hypothetical protein BHE74_00039009 [Ensete ventricosum]|nr:hypothetical protein BHE74_00039009 [Ensete ventricosum]
MAAMLRIVLAMTTVAAISAVAMGANYDVGGPAGSWDLATNYTQWVSGKAFRVGDTLSDSCTTSNPISTKTGGNTVVTLNGTGSRYFICGTLGHCAGGMKLQIDVVAAPTSTPPPPPSPSTTPRSPVAPSPRSPAAPSPRSPSELAPASSTPGSVPPPSTPPTSPPTPSGACLQAKAALGLGSGIVMLMLVAL